MLDSSLMALFNIQFHCVINLVSMKFFVVQFKMFSLITESLFLQLLSRIALLKCGCRTMNGTHIHSYLKVFSLNSKLAGLFLPTIPPEEAKQDSPDGSKAECVGRDGEKDGRGGCVSWEVSLQGRLYIKVSYM